MTKLNRKRGHRLAVEPQNKTISFCFSKIDITQGQNIKEWEQLGLLSIFIERTKQISNYEYQQALAEGHIKQYTKVGFPPDSKFKIPKHVTPDYWAVIHITPKSKEVVAGFLDNNIFYIVFLDKEHEFWPTDIQNRGKNKK